MRNTSGDSGELQPSSKDRVEVEPVGRPTKDYEDWEIVGVRLEPSLIKYLTDLGNGDISKGVKITIKSHQSAQTREDKTD